jgi:hypothetical protein
MRRRKLGFGSLLAGDWGLSSCTGSEFGAPNCRMLRNQRSAPPVMAAHCRPALGSESNISWAAMSAMRCCPGTNGDPNYFLASRLPSSLSSVPSGLDNFSPFTRRLKVCGFFYWSRVVAGVSLVNKMRISGKIFLMSSTEVT